MLISVAMIGLFRARYPFMIQDWPDQDHLGKCSPMGAGCIFKPSPSSLWITQAVHNWGDSQLRWKPKSLGKTEMDGEKAALDLMQSALKTVQPALNPVHRLVSLHCFQGRAVGDCTVLHCFALFFPDMTGWRTSVRRLMTSCCQRARLSPLPPPGPGLLARRVWTAHVHRDHRPGPLQSSGSRPSRRSTRLPTSCTRFGRPNASSSSRTLLCTRSMSASPLCLIWIA